MQGVAQFPHRKSGHCGSGAFRDLLEFHGLSWNGEPLSEGMIFGLSGGLGLDLRRTDDGDEAWRWLREELDAGRPTMVNADIQELNYLRVKLSNTMHDIVVTGYDEDDGVALIADNDREEIQRCALDSLARARGSQGFPGPSRHATWVMRFPGELPEPRAAVDRALRQAAANMREDGEALAGVGSGSGLDHVERFAETYPRLQDALRGLWVFIVKAGTGGAMFRSLQAEFLRESAELLDDAGVAAAADVYEELALEWLALADAAKAGDHAAGLPHVEAIARLERAGVEAMEAAVR